MKNLSNIGISYSSSGAVYNSLEGKSSSYNEAVRTLEALNCVQGHEVLLAQIKEEVTDESSRDRCTNTRSSDPEI